jgi:hypothetical protein
MVPDLAVDRLNQIRVARAQGVDRKVVDQGAPPLTSRNFKRF